MLESHPPASPGRTLGFILVAGLALMDAGLIVLLINGRLTLFTFVGSLLLLFSLPAMAAVAYGAFTLGSARYHVADDTLMIEWGEMRQPVPLAQIRALLWGEKLAAVRRFRGLRWPGYALGRGRVHTADGQQYETVFYASRPFSEQLVVVTPTDAFAISPVDRDNFAACLEALRTGEPRGEQAQPQPDFGILGWRIWRDRWGQGLWGGAALLNGALFAFLCTVYGRLPAQIPLHFNQAGQIDRWGGPGNLFVLPLIGALAWLANGALGGVFYRAGERPLPAYLLWGASVLIQIAAWTAVLLLLSHNAAAG